MGKNKLKVVFLSRYSGVYDRGVETYVLELSKRLSKEFEVEIFNKKDSDDLSKIIKGKFDVVIPTNGRLQSLKVFIGRLLVSDPYKVIIPGQAGVGRDDIWNIFVTNPDVYVALTDFEKDWALNWAFKTKVVKIPNGVDLNKFNPSGKKWTLGLKSPIVLSVGALEWYKRHDLTIKAMSKLGYGSLVIVGKGSLKKSLLDLGNKLLGVDRFKIIEVPFEHMPDVYRSADVFTLPSWIRESFGIVYVEALASGVPVVAPKDSPRIEIIGDGGILVDVLDAERFARALEEALKKDWKNLPRKQAEKFSWDIVSEKYVELINNLC